MRKIAFITSGLLPMPAVKDGAIETLLQYIIDYNEKNNDFVFDIYSIYNTKAKEESINYKNSNFIYIKINKFFYKMSSFIFKCFRKLKIDKDPNFQFQFINKVFKLLKNEEYEYIVVLSENHFAKKILKSKMKNVILYLHNDKLNNNVKNAKFIANNCLEIWTVSEYIKKQVLTIDKNLENNVKVIMNGINLKEFTDIKRKEHEGTNYLYVGRIEESKGILELIKAFNKLDDNNSKLYVVGGSFFSTSKKTNYYKRVINEANNGKNNIIFLGYVSHSKLKEIYSNIDVQVVPSVWQEPGALVNIEAMSSGVKLITTNVGGTKEYVNNDTILIECNENFIDNICYALRNYKSIKSKNTNEKFDINFFSSEQYAKRVIDRIMKVGK